MSSLYPLRHPHNLEISLQSQLFHHDRELLVSIGQDEYRTESQYLAPGQLLYGFDFRSLRSESYRIALKSR